MSNEVKVREAAAKLLNAITDRPMLMLTPADGARVATAMALLDISSAIRELAAAIKEVGPR